MLYLVLVQVFGICFLCSLLTAKEVNFFLFMIFLMNFLFLTSNLFHLQTIDEGMTADFITSLKTSDKTVRITWYKNTTIINESSEIKITFDGTVAHLTIIRGKVSHSATYKVVAQNEFGEDETTAVLTVKEKKEEKEEEEEEEKKKKKVEEKVSMLHFLHNHVTVTMSITL